MLAGGAPNPPAIKCAESNDLHSAFSISEKNIRIEKIVVNEAHQAAVISPDLQQSQCLQVLPGNLTPLPSNMPSQKNLTMHLQYLQKNVFSIFEKVIKSKEKH